MTAHNHLAKTTNVWDATRKIIIPDLKQPSDAEAVEQVLEKLPGIKRVEIRRIKKSVLIRHDVTHIDFRTIIQTLEEAGFPQLDTAWSRIKTAFYAFTDTNTRDSAAERPRPCCNRPPR
jgi:copper chaperone CopZ